MAGTPKPSLLLGVLLKEISSASVISHFQFSLTLININQMFLLALLLFKKSQIPCFSTFSKLVLCDTLSPHLLCILKRPRILRGALLSMVCVDDWLNQQAFHALPAPTPSPEMKITVLGHYCHGVVFRHPETFPLDSCCLFQTYLHLEYSTVQFVELQLKAAAYRLPTGTWKGVQQHQSLGKC